MARATGGKGDGATGARGGRWIALLLVGFLLVASGVIWRRSYGFARARAVHELERRRSALLAEQIRAEGAIRTARSRRVLLPLAESRLGMKVPSDSQVIYIPRPRLPAPPPAPAQ
ncbi:MAG: hypothetical protein ACYC4J_00540 [Gemmatimonadaceae bacterium]